MRESFSPLGQVHEEASLGKKKINLAPVTSTEKFNPRRQWSSALIEKKM